MSFIRALFCLHRYELIGASTLFRVVDNRPVGSRLVSRCCKCGHITHRDV